MPEYAIAHDHVRAAMNVDRMGDALCSSPWGSKERCTPPP